MHDLDVVNEPSVCGSDLTRAPTLPNWTDRLLWLALPGNPTENVCLPTFSAGGFEGFEVMLRIETNLKAASYIRVWPCNDYSAGQFRWWGTIYDDDALDGSMLLHGLVDTSDVEK